MNSASHPTIGNIFLISWHVIKLKFNMIVLHILLYNLLFYKQYIMKIFYINSNNFPLSFKHSHCTFLRNVLFKNNQFAIVQHI